MYSWDPFREMKRIKHEMNSLYNNNFLEGQHPFIDSKDVQLPSERFRFPKASVREEGTNIIANFEIPGALKEDIELNVTLNEIELKVQNKASTKTEDKKTGLKQYNDYRSQFYRKVPLMLDLDSERAEATYHDGILTVEIPKKLVEDNKKRINIQ